MLKLTSRYIQNPDEYDILAVIETSPRHQHEALRELIVKFFSFETSIKASITASLHHLSVSVYLLTRG